MDFKTLRNGQRYLFHIKPEHGYKKFRANLVDILYIYQGTIRFTKIEFANIADDRSNITNSPLVTMPLAWIEKMETLEEILDKEKDTTNKTLTLIPSETLLEVDEFL
jgi:hypothetical protein